MLIDRGSKPKAYIDVRDVKKIEKILDLLEAFNIPFYPKSEVEGCDGNSEIKNICVRTKIK